MLDHFKLLVLDGVNLNSTPAFDQHVRECLDITLADYGMLRFPPSYIAWAVLEKAFALTRAHGKSGLVRTVTPDHLVDGAGGGAPPLTTVLDLPGLPPMASHVWAPCAKQMGECVLNLDRLYREHEGEPEEEPPASNADSEAEIESELENAANAEVAAYDKPSTPGASAHLRGATPNGVEAADEIFCAPHESGTGAAVKPAVASAESGPAGPAVGAAAAAAAQIANARASKRPMSPGFAGYTEARMEAQVAASNKRRKL